MQLRNTSYIVREPLKRQFGTVGICRCPRTKITPNPAQTVR